MPTFSVQRRCEAVGCVESGVCRVECVEWSV